MKGSTQICEELARYGVTDVFGLAGDGNYRYLAELAGYGIRFHPARHENGAIAMAAGYARSSGRIGVCTVTHGPGLTHAMSALVEAAKARAPIVLLASDTPTWPTAYSCQETDQAGLLTTAGLHTERVRAVGTLARDLARGFAHARDRAEPIALLIPTDVQDDECEYAPTRIVPPGASEPSAAAVEELAERLLAAERPLLIGGRGARGPDARALLERLAERTDALLGTTALAMGLFAGTPFALGVVGGYSPQGIKELIRAADLVIGFGASFSTWTTHAGRNFAPDATLVQVDRASHAIGAHAPVAMGVVADVIPTVEALLAELERADPAPTLQRTAATAERIADARQMPFDDAGTDELVDPRAAFDQLDVMLPAERTVCTDGGWHQGAAVVRLSPPDAEGFVFWQTSQAVGIGLGSAIGAAIGRPDRLAVIVIGDGGLSMSLSELVTAATCGRPVLLIVVNDAAYAAEVEGLRWLGLPTDVGYLAELDFVAIARALGADGITVRQVDELEPLESWLREPSGIFVVELRSPCPIDYGGEDEWIERIWHVPRGQPAPVG